MPRRKSSITSSDPSKMTPLGESMGTGAYNRTFGYTRPSSYRGSPAETAVRTQESAAATSASKQAKVLGSFKQGGTVPKTGAYKLHKGEKVLPQVHSPAADKQIADTLKGKASALRSEASGYIKAGGKPSSTTDEMYRKASQFEGMVAHGANGNMVHSKSAAIAPHDKDN